MKFRLISYLNYQSVISSHCQHLSSIFGHVHRLVGTQYCDCLVRLEIYNCLFKTQCDLDIIRVKKANHRLTTLIPESLICSI